ncbi:hypothetical protein HQ585_09035 [candidate division KSB1 bacterium]|nr:hypothetical protein [candidate division KSB1 bacterium]
MYRAQKLLKLFLFSVLGFIIITFSLGLGCSESTTEPELEVKADYYTPKLSAAPTIDGDNSDEVWQSVPWAGIAYWITGDTVTDPNDFSGRYKIGWTEQKIYLLVEITDDDFSSCFDDINMVSNDDCVVLFLDEDQSGGPFQSNHQAFSYFIEMDSSVVDFTTDQNANFAYFNDHVEVAQVKKRNTNTWELAVDVFSASYSESIPAQANMKATLESGKQMGMTVAYFDADLCQTSCLYGSCEPLENVNTMIWEDADHFGTVILTE